MRFVRAVVLSALCFLSQWALAETPAAPAKPVFRLHLFSEPTNFYPRLQKGANAGYVLTQTHWSYLRYQDGKLLPALAEKCEFASPIKVVCTLRKNLKFSDGSPILTRHWKKPLLDMLDPEDPVTRADLLFPIRNAKEILQRKKRSSELGVLFRGNLVIFQLHEPYADFLYHLTASHLAPIPDQDFKTPEDLAKWPTPGPYRFLNYIPAQQIQLTANPQFFDQKHKSRPDIRFLFVSEDAVALNMYKTGLLDFNRRLPALHIPEFEKSAELDWIPMLRFDYIGLRGFLSLEQRKALAASLNFSEMQKLMHSPPRPGCPGVPELWFEKPLCHEFQPNDTHRGLFREQKKKTKFFFSRLGGDDHRRAMEWVQAQWQTRLEFKLDLSQLDNSFFVSELEKNDPILFRKGLSLDRPTCLAAVEQFATGATENYLHLNDDEVNSWIARLRKERNEKKQKVLCTQIVRKLIDEAHIIPTGPYLYALLTKPNWSGLKMNELGELDLSELVSLSDKGK